MARHDFRRAIVLSADHEPGTPGRVVADLEDDHHRFRVTLDHDGTRARTVAGETRRAPWTTCAEGPDRLDDLTGARLSPRSGLVGDTIDAPSHCTHLLDLTSLAIAQAARGGRRRYDLHIPRPDAGRTRPTLRRDGELVLVWEVRDGTIVGPAPFTGVGLGSGFTRWAAVHLSTEAAEAACVLRRMVDLMTLVDLRADDAARPADHPVLRRPVCYTYQDDVLVRAARPAGHVPGGVDWGDRLPLT